MAKVQIAGEAVVLVSNIKLDDFKLVDKYRPEELVVKGGEDGKTPIFRVAVTDNSGTVSKYGVAFGRETSDGNASVTMIDTSGSKEDIKERFSDELGAALIQLEKIEQAIPAIIEEIKAEKESIKSKIEVL